MIDSKYMQHRGGKQITYAKGNDKTRSQRAAPGKRLVPTRTACHAASSRLVDSVHLRIFHGAATQPSIFARMRGVQVESSHPMEITEVFENLFYCSAILVYLHEQTWKQGKLSDEFAAEVKAAVKLGIPLILAHEMTTNLEQDARSCKGCAFEDTINATPLHIRKLNIYSKVAVPLRAGPWRATGLKLLARRVVDSLGAQSNDSLGLARFETMLQRRRLSQTLSERSQTVSTHSLSEPSLVPGNRSNSLKSRALSSGDMLSERDFSLQRAASISSATHSPRVAARRNGFALSRAVSLRRSPRQYQVNPIGGSVIGSPLQENKKRFGHWASRRAGRQQSAVVNPSSPKVVSIEQISSSVGSLVEEDEQGRPSQYRNGEEAIARQGNAGGDSEESDDAEVKLACTETALLSLLVNARRSLMDKKNELTAKERAAVIDRMKDLRRQARVRNQDASTVSTPTGAVPTGRRKSSLPISLFGSPNVAGRNDSGFSNLSEMATTSHVSLGTLDEQRPAEQQPAQPWGISPTPLETRRLLVGRPRMSLEEQMRVRERLQRSRPTYYAKTILDLRDLHAATVDEMHADGPADDTDPILGDLGAPDYLSDPGTIWDERRRHAAPSLDTEMSISRGREGRVPPSWGVARLQRLLCMRGYYDGPQDGTHSNALSAAVIAFQRVAGIVPPSGVADARTMAMLLQRRHERQIHTVAPWTPPITVRAFARERDDNLMRMLDRFCLRPAVGVVYTSYQPPAMGPGEPSIRDDPYVKELKRHAAMSMLPVGLPPSLNTCSFGSSNQSSFAAPRTALRIPNRLSQLISQRGELDPSSSTTGATLRPSPVLTVPDSPNTQAGESEYDRSRREAWIEHYVSTGQLERARRLGWRGDDGSQNESSFEPLIGSIQEDASSALATDLNFSEQSARRNSYQIEDMDGLDELSEPHEFSPSLKRNSSVL